MTSLKSHQRKETKCQFEFGVFVPCSTVDQTRGVPPSNKVSIADHLKLVQVDLLLGIHLGHVDSVAVQGDGEIVRGGQTLEFE